METSAASAPTKIQIRHRWNGRVLFECGVPAEVASGMALRHALEKAAADGSLTTEF